MYAAHFGLKYRPFGSGAGRASIFVGPQQATTLAGLKKGLVARDAIVTVTVTGPKGVGKTAIVARALESISPDRMVAWLNRTQLAPDAVLDLLLTEFGTRQAAQGTIQRFAALRRLLIERAAAGVPAVIIVEDAMRIGIDALLDLEALTAADTGDASSASIILMGPPELNTLLATPELARLHRRNRLAQTIAPFGATEVHNYLTQRIGEAGGDYDAIFEAAVTDIVHHFSAGIPEIINTLCETALTRAAETDATRVSASLMRQVAAENDATATITEHAAADSAPEAIAASEVSTTLSEVIVESGRHPNITPAAVALDFDDPVYSEAGFEKYAAEIGNANCLEDISDLAAETIFGNEVFDDIAAAVTANPNIETPAPVSLRDAKCSATANDSINAKPATRPRPKDMPATSIMDSTAKSRLAMVRALNKRMSTDSPPIAATNHLNEDQPKTRTAPAPNENQINASMIQKRNSS